MTLLRNSLLTPRPQSVRRAIETVGRFAGLALLGGTMLTSAGCSMDKLVGKKDLPSTLVDPGVAKSPHGAYANYAVALINLRDAVGKGFTGYVNITGLLSDEGRYYYVSAEGQNLTGGNIDARIIPEDRRTSVGFTYYAMYSGLQLVRGQANQAQELLRDFYPDSAKKPLMAHMLAAKGYAELMLAEAFCSGVPLSTLDYNGDYTLRPGSTTDAVLDVAIAHFDSALALAGDSARILNFARVGKGRALLQLGKFPEAAQAVDAVPVEFRYDLMFNRTAKACGLLDCTNPLNPVISPASDSEGGNGLPYVTAADPRIPAFAQLFGDERWFMVVADNHTIRLASGVEAQLIRAEAELKAGNPNWLVRLNTLRTTCTDAATCASPAPAGAGAVAGLPPLSDPGTDAARVTMLFRERAFWTYFTGHRQGDLRRLVRRYGRNEWDVYPTGPYGTDFRYGTDVNLPIPQDELKLNPNFHGCFDRKA